MPPKESVPNPKELLWEEKLRSLDAVIDRLGMHIDNEIKETLAAFNLNGLPTHASCGGHLEADRLRYPFVWCAAEGRPKHFHVGAEDLENEVAEKYSITSKDLRTHREAGIEYFLRLKRLEVTEEAKAWLLYEQSFRERLEALLEEFYQTRNGPKDVRISSEKKMASGYYLVTTNYVPPKEIIAKGEFAEGDIDEMRADIILAREEFQVFGDFLKQKYLAEG